MKKRTMQAVLLVVLIIVSVGVWVWMNPTMNPEPKEPTGIWTEMSPEVIPPTRFDSLFIFDNESDVAILFGGGAGVPPGVRINDTWAYSYEFDTWENKSPTVAPPARMASQAAYDSGSDRIILFSGFLDMEVHFNDTWAYDYNTNNWTNLNPQVMPPMRRYSAMAYDAESDRIILFGGIFHDGGTAGDTWAYDYDTNTWANMNPSFAPSPRFYSVMAYDSESDRIILFSGCYPNVFTDTWAYDYNTNTWQNMNPSENPGAYPGGLIYDAEEDLCITYVGSIDFDETQLSNETWSYDYNSNSWTEYSVSTSPSVRTRAKIVYDHNSDVMLLYGGLGLGRFDEQLDDTWSFAFEEPITTLYVVDGNVDLTLVLIAAGAGVVIIVLVVFMRRR